VTGDPGTATTNMPLDLMSISWIVPKKRQSICQYNTSDMRLNFILSD
jgi:hypothetical protein